MSEIIYKTIGKRGRTTIPFSFRRDLKITDKRLLKFTRCGSRVVITPMIELEEGICESGAMYNLKKPEDAERLLENCSAEAFKRIQKAVLSKLNTSAKEKIGVEQQQKS